MKEKWEHFTDGGITTGLLNGSQVSKTSFGFVCFKCIKPLANVKQEENYDFNCL